MAEIKCSRCDRRYSSLRSRCPYCGTRRSSRGKRVAESDNSLWKLVIGILILTVLLVAVIILIVNAVKGDGNTTPAPSPSPSYSAGDGVVTVSGDDLETPSPSPSEEPSPSPTLSAESVAITFGGRTLTDFTLSRGESLSLGLKILPEAAAENATVIWETSNEDVFLVTQAGKVTWTGSGNATLTVTVDGVKVECIVRCK